MQKKVSDAPVLSELHVWNDPVARDGPTNMAVDEWLWRSAEKPILRLYCWTGEWMSIGYFSRSSAVPANRNFVRRPTGGGLVDHGSDWTYTLVIPRGHELAEMRGALSYEVIHQALCDALGAEGINCRLLADEDEQSSDFCFRRPVRHDLVWHNGEKIAGAGQRRGKQGLLHQGSVQAVAKFPLQRGFAIASCLADAVTESQVAIDETEVRRLSDEVYRLSSWNRRR
jgi:lipoate-protein ligase A